ncbi:hypothetical protein L6164_019037 [Bauhinia variegata]|uniref:Uncharacterized protein n=1 Tax=Bauhinia variegata TaxID=167791 RepID=A0ACB9ND60_BAUVA|nr:hypothetical protein L6164_019037 [Bauhinia variegata]
MEVPKANPSPSPVRVLIRPPTSSATTSSSSSQSLPNLITPTPTPTPTPAADHASSSSFSRISSKPTSTPISASPSQPRSLEGIVVVGFVAPRAEYSSQLINRVIDSNVFGSGNLDKRLSIEEDQVRDWFKWRTISYYHYQEKGILFLQFCSTSCPAIHGFTEPAPAFDSVVEEQEFGDLQGMLFMFSVCHVIIYIQEGSQFNTRVLRNFRVLQAAKHAMAPFIRSQTTPSLPSRPRSSSSSRPSTSANSSPGQCTPVTLFVFIDDFSNLPNTTANLEDSSDNSSLNQPSSLSSLVKANLPAKGSGSVVVLAHPASRSEGGIRKKLQSSLETQIRFLIKKCRTLSSSEISHSDARTGSTSTTAPLFSLDASRAVVLLDRISSQSGGSLEFAVGLVEDVLNGKATSDSLLLETHGQNANVENITSVKEFIYRQSDILRGRGGLVNANSSSAGGVGMVAVAAAAAAASVASGKTFTIPDLPNFEVWLSSSHHILNRLLCAKGGCLDEFEISKRKPRSRNTALPATEGTLKSTDPLDLAVSWLQSGRGLNTKFSTLWCQRAIPAAKEIYLKDLPRCYPTSQHEVHLEKALHTFRSMVKGPAVQLFAKKLEEECTSIWKSGRQLCDAVSLTGKPCMHQRHDIETRDSDFGLSKSHSSGYFFLHACACGRTRQLCPDPFDFESADASCFSDCDKLLPSLKLPEVKVSGPIQSSSWSLLRIGGSRYYEPSKGLLQSGFCAPQKFLLKWTIYLEKQKKPNGSTESIMKQGSVIRAPKVESIADTKKYDVRQSFPVVQNGEEDQRTSLDIIKPDDKNINFGRGLPNFKMKKPFSEVVAGSAATDSGFPPLQQRKLPASASDKGMKQRRTRDQSAEQVNTIVDRQVSQKSQDVSLFQEPLDGNSDNSCMVGDPFLQIGSNVVPVYLNGGERSKSHSSLKHVIVYVGFEHECPHGHRFMLNNEHLNELGSSYSFTEKSVASSVEPSDSNLTDHTKVSKNTRWYKVHQTSNEILAASINKERDLDRSKLMIANGVPNQNQNIMTFSEHAKPPNLMKDLGRDFQPISMDGGDLAFSMLNRNLPIYMSCPHCRLSRNKKDAPKVKFASTISQLQRIFLVTPALPMILATCPTVQFEASCLPPSVPDRERKLQFSLGCQVVLPPESFLVLKLPFVYGVQLEDGNMHPLNPFEQQPEMTAWVTKGTALQILSKGSNDEGYQTR